jgi:hypothetical protein
VLKNKDFVDNVIIKGRGELGDSQSKGLKAVLVPAFYYLPKAQLEYFLCYNKGDRQKAI